MKYLPLLMLFFFSNSLLGNGVVDTQNKYVIFCKTYGFVKYHSHQIYNKEIDWDAHTYKYLKLLEKTDDIDSFNKLLREYLTLIHPSENKKGEILKKVGVSIVDNEWLKTSWINIDIRKKLLDLQNDIPNKKHPTFDLSEKKMVVNHLASHTIENQELDKYHYLLGFFQLWNIVEYFYPYKDLFEDYKWDEILYNEIPNLIYTKSRVQYINALKHLTTYLKDSHSFVKDLKTRDSYTRHALGFSLVENKVVLFGILNDSLKKIYKIKKGDALTHINRQPIDSVLKVYSSLHSHSNNVISKYYFSRQLSFWLSDTTIFTFNDTINIISKKITYNKIDLSDYYNKIVIDKEIDEQIGYINTSEISYFKFGRILRKFRNKPFIIFDCRGYASLAVLRYGKLLGGGPKDVAKFNYPYYKHPGTFKEGRDNYFGSSFEIGLKLLGLLNRNAGKLIPSFRKPFKNKGIIIINERAVSFGETNIMALKTYCKDCITIGTNTTGANGNVSTGKLIGDVEFGYTGIRFSFANGSQVQKIGIKPDIKIETKISDFINDKDTLLDFSIEYIRNKN
jgi:carboxyl-terminal processing protease